MFGMAERDLCSGCGVCAAVCREDAIQMIMDREGFRYPVLDLERCIRCGRCGAACSKRDADNGPVSNTYWGARAREEEVRHLSSSGGIFPLLASRTIEDGGVVFGASLREDGTVTHIKISHLEEIPLIARTKYVQSQLSQVWTDILPPLEDGRPVLFCGTPCQAAALWSYLGKARQNLILVDLICYGVPSPGIWGNYVNYLEQKYGRPFQDFFFRDKRNRDNGHTAVLRTGGREHIWPLGKDPFCRSYFQNVNLRPACFQCGYCTPYRTSDLTIGDFWGVEEIRPDFADGMGTSAVICHTLAGLHLWERVRDQTQWFSCREEDVVNQSQPRLREPVKQSPRRAWYMGLYGRIPFPIWLQLFRR